MPQVERTTPGSGGQKKRSPAVVAALVNVLLVLLAPLALSLAAIHDASSRGNTVSAAPPGTLIMSNVIQLVSAVVIGVPFAAIAGWRTWVHAKEYCAARSNGWRGVAEATGLGLCLPALALWRIVLVRPGQSAPYVIAYSLISASIGFAIGLLLWLSAVIVLRLAGCRSANPIAQTADQ